MKENLLCIIAAATLMVGCNKDYDLNQNINLKMSLLQGELGLPLTTMDLEMDSIINMIDFGSNFSEEGGLYKIKYEAELDAQVIEAPKVDIPSIDDVMIGGIASKAFELSGLGETGVTLDQVIASELSFDITNQANMEMSPSPFAVTLAIPSSLIKLKTVHFDNLYIIIETTLSGLKGSGTQPVASIAIQTPDAFNIEGPTSFNLAPTTQSSGYSKIELKLNSITNADNALTPPYLYEFRMVPTILPYTGLSITNKDAHAKIKITIESRSAVQAPNLVHYTTLEGAFDINQKATTEVDLSDLIRDLKGNILTNGALLRIPVENTTGISSLLNLKAYNRDKPTSIYINDTDILLRAGKDTISYADEQITAIITDRASKLAIEIEAHTDPSRLYTFNTANTNEIKARYDLTVPFSFKKGSNLEVVQTANDAFSGIGEIVDMVGSDLYIEAIATNMIPFEIMMKLEALDSNQQSLLTLADNLKITAAPSDGDGLSTASATTPLKLTLTPAQLQLLKRAIHARITFGLITESNDIATIRSTDQLSLKLSAKKGKGGIIIDLNK